jgi:protein-S-isoprenylcysteine O-methyltransferase Ste14
MGTYVFLILLWLLFYALHSFFASGRVKRKIYALAPAVKAIYRILYHLMSIGLFTAIVILSLRMKEQPVFSFHGAMTALGAVLALAGIAIMIRSFQAFDTREFIFGTPRDPDQQLIKNGWYGRVRHPLYLGTVLVLISLLILYPYPSAYIFVLISFLYLPFGIYWEEKKLLDTFGETYRQYMQEVPQLIPKLL